MKKVKGFTLVELIVVIAIIVVLAVILVPALMGWVVKSRITTYNNNASEVCSQLQTVITEMSTDKNISYDVPDCTIVYSGGSITGVTDPGASAKILGINNNLTDISGVEWAAKVENQTVKSVVISGNNCTNVGGFPIQCPKDQKFSMTSSDITDYVDCAIGANGKNWDTYRKR